MFAYKWNFYNSILLRFVAQYIVVRPDKKYKDIAILMFEWDPLQGRVAVFYNGAGGGFYGGDTT